MSEDNWVSFKLGYNEALVFPASQLLPFVTILSQARVLKTEGYSSNDLPVAMAEIPGFSFVTHEAVMGAIARARMQPEEKK